MDAGTLPVAGLLFVISGVALTADATTYVADTSSAAMQSVVLTNSDVLTSSSIVNATFPTNVGTPIFHLDATVTNGWQLMEAGGLKYVRKLPSVNGNGRYLEFRANDPVRTYVSWVNGPYLRTGVAELNRGNVLDFGPQSSGLGLYFDGGRLTDIGTIIAIWGSQNGGGWVLGGGEWTNSSSYVHSGYGFHRGTNPQDPANGDNSIIAASRIFKDPAYLGVVNSRCWLDGTEVNPTTMGFSGGYQLLSVVCTNLVPWAAGLGINDTRGNYRSGGQRIAEMIIFSQLLTDEQRRLVEAYLTEKWFGRPYVGYNHRAAVAEIRTTEMCEIAVPQDETLAATRVADIGSPKRTAPIRQTVKSGAGTWQIADAAGLGGAFLWQAGGLVFARRPIPAALPTNSVLHVDASVSSSYDSGVDADGVTRLTVWRDVDGRRFAASPLTEANRPSVLTNALNGKTVIDFGAYTSGQFLQWNTNMTYMGTVLWVIGAQNGGGHLMGHSTDNGCHFQRGGNGGSQTSPIWSSGGARIAMRACPTYVNGVRVNGTNAFLDYTYQVVAVQAPGAFANQFAGHLSTSTDYSRSGGQRLAEVIAYNRLLSDQELADAQAYLMRKWLNADAPGYARQSRSRPDLQSISAEGGTPLTIDGHAVRVGTLSGTETLTKKGSGDLEIQDTSLFLGSISLQAGNFKIAAPTVSDNSPAEEPVFHLDATRKETFELTALNGTNFIRQWTDIRGWRNAARRFDTSPSRPLPWLRTDDLANGNPVVDFGVRASCRALVFDKPVSAIRAAYIVIGTQDACGNFLLGSYAADVCDFHRGGTDTLDDRTRAILGGYDFSQPLRDGSIYIDGVKTNYTAGLSGGYQVVEFHPTAGVRASALACDRYGGAIDVGNVSNESIRRTGGQRLGEVILYDRPLSERERVATRNYLLKKWLNREPVAMPSESSNALRQLTIDAASNVTFSAEQATSLFALTGAGVFQKAGSSALSIVDTSAFTGTVHVAEGLLSITGTLPPVTPELITNGLTFHADATKHVEWVWSAGQRRVTRWGSSVGDGWFVYPQVNQPEYKGAQLGGLPVVDLGPMGSLQHLLFCNTNATLGVTNKITNIRSVFWVMGSQNGGSYLLGGGTNGAAHYNFHRGPKPGTNDIANPITADYYLWGGPTDARIRDITSQTYLNGVATNGTTTGLSGGYDLIGLVMNQYATEAEGFAFDGRYLENKSYGERSGGQRLAEVLIYDRPLSNGERQRVESYLQQKWTLKPYRAGVGSAMTLSIGSGGAVDLGGSVQPIANLVGGGSVSSGTLQILNGMNVGEGDGNTGVLTISGGLMLNDGVVIDVDLSPLNADRVVVSGACTLGANVTIHVRNAASVCSTPLYRTALLACGSLVSAANISSWTVTGDIPAGYNTALSVQDGTVWLRVSRQGSLMLLR